MIDDEIKVNGVGRKNETDRDSLLLGVTRQEGDSCQCGGSVAEGTGCGNHLGKRWIWRV